MNKEADFKNSATVHGRKDLKAERAGRAGRARQAARGRVEHRSKGGGPLTKAAERLLAALCATGAEGIVDPTDEGMLILRQSRSGISVGAGRFPAQSAEALVRHDLARWVRASGVQGVLQVTGAGCAYLKRRAGNRDEAFLRQHVETGSAVVETEAGPTRVRVNAEESPLAWLRRRKGRDGQPFIDEASFRAGERLREDITLAGLLPGVTARWDMPKTGGPSSPADATDRMVAARQRIRHAFEAVGGDFSDLLMDLCGFLKGLELIEQERQWPPRSAKVIARMALARLAEHYGFEAVARGPSASRGIRAWQAVVIEGGRG
jgi:hypothetical protein